MASHLNQPRWSAPVYKLLSVLLAKVAYYATTRARFFHLETNQIKSNQIKIYSIYLTIILQERAGY